MEIVDRKRGGTRPGRICWMKTGLACARIFSAKGRDSITPAARSQAAAICVRSVSAPGESPKAAFWRSTIDSAEHGSTAAGSLRGLPVSLRVAALPLGGVIRHEGLEARVLVPGTPRRARQNARPGADWEAQRGAVPGRRGPAQQAGPARHGGRSTRVRPSKPGKSYLLRPPPMSAPDTVEAVLSVQVLGAPRITSATRTGEPRWHGGCTSSDHADARNGGPYIPFAICFSVFWRKGRARFSIPTMTDQTTTGSDPRTR